MLAEWAHNSIQNALYQLSLVWGCHQLKERSFCIRRRQTPLCARCMGILTGTVFLPLYHIYSHWWISMLFIGVFFLDAATQYAGLRQSRNWLRFSTGVAFSVAVISLAIEILHAS